jgi:mono/diheme cytochrome c family protein
MCVLFRFPRWLACAVAASALAAPGPSANPLPAAVDAVIGKHCAKCHQGTTPPAGIHLRPAALAIDVPAGFERWVRIHDAVRDGKMPPAGAPALSTEERTAFLAGLSAALVRQEKETRAAAGRVVLRRLNRYEYENTLRELLGAPWLQVRDGLPEDGIAYRFNKSGQALDVSHVQMARYLETAEQAIRATLATAAQPLEKRRYWARQQQRFLNRMRCSSFNRHPERATIPVLGFEAQPDVLAEKAPITVGAADPAIRELEAFATPASTYIGNEYHFDEFAAPSGGRYRLRFNAYSLWIHTLRVRGARGDGPDWWRPDREKTSRGRTVEPLTIYALSRGGEKRLLGSFDVTPEPAVHSLDVSLLAGEQILPDAARLFRSRPGFVGSPDATAEGMPGVAYRWMEVEGPVPSGENRVRVSAATEKDAEALMRAFLDQAYRRPPTEAEVQRYAAIVRPRFAKDPREAMIAGYAAALCSPAFLYLEEKPGPLEGAALANRLAYFLWNGPPDPALRAANGRLRQRALLRRQAERLLDDPRSSAFLEAFLDYWLDLRRLSDTTPDQTLYPDYYLDDLLTESALNETRLFFAELVRANLPARNIVHSGFTFLNAHLARHYGIPGVDGVAMRRVTLPEGSVRGGLLTQASVLKVTANGTTTSPVLRGVWITERILGETVPPPPSGVSAVEPDTRGATTIRQQLDKHRSTPSCAGCHVRIDPPGFALESFDILGAWREKYRSTEEGESVTGVGKNGHEFAFRLGQPVDAAGELPGGRAFSGIREFRALLAADERRVARNLAVQLITFATGAPPGFSDRAGLERILDACRKSGYGVRDLIHEIIQSELFTRK